MYYLNLAACVFLIGVIIVEIWFILHVNKQIRIKGKDDFFTGALVMLFVILIFPLTENLQMIEIVRNILLLAALFTMAVRRVLTDRGVQKLSPFLGGWTRSLFRRSDEQGTVLFRTKQCASIFQDLSLKISV